MNTMKISIVTISFNQARFLEKAICSIIEQDYHNIEYIIVDPGSTDGSREIIENYKDKIDKIIFEPDEGPADGLNKGFSYATGDIFFYLNADDMLLPGALRSVEKEFQKFPRMDVLLAHGFQINAEGQRARKIFSTKWSPYLYAIGLAQAIQQATFFRREAFLAAGGFNQENRTCWDGELVVDMALAGAMVKLRHDFLGAFRKYPDSISGSGRLKAAYQNDRLRISRKILGRCSDWREKLAYWYCSPLVYALTPTRSLYKLWFKVYTMKQSA